METGVRYGVDFFKYGFKSSYEEWKRVGRAKRWKIAA